MEEKKDLWKLVRKKLEKNSELATENFTDDEKIETIKIEENSDKINEPEESSPSRYINKEKVSIEKGRKPLLEQGIFAGLIYILTIMIILGILMIPGSITAAIEH